jgi:Major Facilitator Superfamily
MWYKREESQKRFTVYFSSTIVAGAFGGLLASAIAKMDGIGGLENWRWVFILEGLATIVVGIAAFFFVSDFPDDVKWLTEEERAFVVARVAAGDKKQPITSASVFRFFKDPMNLLGGIMYLSMYCSKIPAQVLPASGRTKDQGRRLTNIDSIRHATLRLRVLHSHYSPNIWLLRRADTAPHRSTHGLCPCRLSAYRLFLRPHPPAQPLHLLYAHTRHHRRRHPCFGTKFLPRTVSGHLHGRHGQLRQRHHHRMLVRHESARARRPQHWQRLDDRLWEHRRHHCHVFLFGRGCAALSHRIQSLHRLIVYLCWVVRRLCCSGLEAESAAKGESNGWKRRVVLFIVDWM